MRYLSDSAHVYLWEVHQMNFRRCKIKQLKVQTSTECNSLHGKKTLYLHICELYLLQLPLT